MAVRGLSEGQTKEQVELDAEQTNYVKVLLQILPPVAFREQLVLRTSPLTHPLPKCLLSLHSVGHVCVLSYLRKWYACTMTTWLPRLDQSFVVIQNQVLARQFSHSHALQARHFVKKKPLSKGQLANIARKKALKKGKSIFDAEKMTLADAIHVLRVSFLTFDLSNFLTLSKLSSLSR